MIKNEKVWSVLKKLYISLQFLMLTIASVIFIVTTVTVAHDQYYSRSFAIWNSGNHTWATLPEKHILTLKNIAKDNSEGRLLGPRVKDAGVRFDKDNVPNEGDLKFYFLQEYGNIIWGPSLPWLSWDSTEMRPLSTILYSSVLFLVPLFTMFLKKWIIWLISK